MGQRIDDVNELETLREKAHKWDVLTKILEGNSDYQRWLKEQSEEKTVVEEDDGIPGEVPRGRPKCFSCCAENPEWLLKKFGVTQKQCDECKHHKACFKAY